MLPLISALTRVHRRLGSRTPRAAPPSCGTSPGPAAALAALRRQAAGAMVTRGGTGGGKLWMPWLTMVACEPWLTTREWLGWLS